MNEERKDKVIACSISQELKDCYIDYAMSVIVSRAIPDCRDGLKPVQRRILYSMKELGLTPTVKFKKSAMVVGHAMGRYHPHGDMAIYDSLVRMAQPFSLRYTLVNGQGNFGSIDGDSAAAQRYTECRMTHLANEMFNDIEKETVDFVPNYDNNLSEPKVLPTRIPQLLLNGTTGIAVGMATNIPPHNLSECMDAAIFLADNPDCDSDNLLDFIQGPDFPTGGTIYGWNEIKEAYNAGKGRVLIRGTAEIVEHGKTNQIVISEIPYAVNKSELIKKIANLIENKKILHIKDIRDESDKKGLTITIDLKREANPRNILNQLYKYTDLEKYFHINSIALVEDGLQPELLSLKSILKEFIEFRKSVIFKRTQFLLRKTKERLHILEGLKTALDHIDEIIDIIKKSDGKEDANIKLCKKFKFTEVQATVILETKLQAIAKLEKIKILNELKDKSNDAKDYEETLKNQKKIIKIMKQEFIEIKEKFGDERKTKLVKNTPDKIEESDLIPDLNVFITLSQDGYIKRMDANMFRTQNRGGKGITAYSGNNDDLLEHILNVSTKDTLLLFSDKGKVYQTGAYAIKDSSRESRGKAIQNFIDITTDEKVTVVLGHNEKVAKDKNYLIMATESGVIKKTPLSEFKNIRKNGLLSIKLGKDDLLKWADFSSGNDLICLVTKKGQSITFSEKDVRSMGRSSSGVTGIKLGKDDKVVSMMVIDKNIDKNKGSIVSLTQFGFGKKTLIKEYRLQKRGGSGIKNFKISEKTGLLVSSKLAIDQGVLMAISKKGLVLQTDLGNIPCLSRTTQGVRIMKLSAGDEVSEVSLL
jgi:DNA gyrase subunit A